MYNFLYAFIFRFMAELGAMVPIIPVVTKADTMTTAEASAFREEVLTKLSKAEHVFRGTRTGLIIIILTTNRINLAAVQ